MNEIHILYENNSNQSNFKRSQICFRNLKDFMEDAFIIGVNHLKKIHHRLFKQRRCSNLNTLWLVRIFVNLILAQVEENILLYSVTRSEKKGTQRWVNCNNK